MTSSRSSSANPPPSSPTEAACGLRHGSLDLHVGDPVPSSEYNHLRMRTTSIAKAAVAVGISFWIAVAACVFGCLPAFAHAAKQNPPLCKPDALQSHDTDCCHHESQSTPGDDNQSSPHPGASCCPTEAALTPTHNWHTAPVATSFALAAIPATPSAFALLSWPLAHAQAFGSPGRDTLRKTHVLRI
jgi:hypothetical protein